MRALIQRVTQASVVIAGETVGQIGQGLLILLGVRQGDTTAEAEFLADKCLNLRIFEDAAGKMNLSLLDIEGEMLVVSQFTLYGDTRRGRRPSFIDAAPPETSEPLYEYFVERLACCGLPVATGRFGANMEIHLVNDGPVTILLEKEHEDASAQSSPGSK
ncbi:MAG: D-tyrosyl-tRNA(Tyr) deacylase [Lentisphaerae bacterium]|jgi:D-tyrosyl-tRNA(Tyr) deacylase|nr:D-tyrosyl-tRNA(Tyr) deacylase [Lentisphaerota bacterium]